MMIRDKERGERESPLLNEYQRRSLTVMFRMIEETLNRLERLLRSTGEHHLMYAIHNTYTAAEREAMLRSFESLRARLAEGQEVLQLGKVHVNLRSVVSADMSVLWEQLVDSLADKLKRYGEVTPETRRTVDPIIEGLIQDILDILKIQPEP